MKNQIIASLCLVMVLLTSCSIPPRGSNLGYRTILAPSNGVSEILIPIDSYWNPYKYTVEYKKDIYEALPQCDLGGGRYCLTAHYVRRGDTLIKKEFDNRDSAMNLAAALKNHIFNWYKEIKIDSVIIGCGRGVNLEYLMKLDSNFLKVDTLL